MTTETQILRGLTLGSVYLGIPQIVQRTPGLSRHRAVQALQRLTALGCLDTVTMENKHGRQQVLYRRVGRA